MPWPDDRPGVAFGDPRIVGPKTTARRERARFLTERRRERWRHRIVRLYGWVPTMAEIHAAADRILSGGRDDGTPA